MDREKERDMETHNKGERERKGELRADCNFRLDGGLLGGCGELRRRGKIEEGGRG